ncbi:unnamed protein product [Phytophthora lilii]|uniref:Unnamed protein product n=1 Tax=Phytophthora lilii TaxID=2077276 RepID=A0A9W6XEA5_9STRA|nr:unnamed protein product [Phytophthora lilii]
MERKDRKRKAQEIAESPQLVSKKITELATELAETDAILRKEIGDLRDEVGSLKKQIVEKGEECERLEAEAAYLHPDAVIDRVKTKLWHNGDLSLLRKVLDPRPRVLRNIEARSDRHLYLCDVAPKKAGGKAPARASDASADETSPKPEREETPVPSSVPSASASMLPPVPTEAYSSGINISEEEKEEKEKEDGEREREEETSVPPVSGISEKAGMSPRDDTINEVQMDCTE